MRRKPGVKIAISKVKDFWPDHLAPFEGLWGYSRDLQDDYNGTIFRFPLRTAGTKSILVKDLIDTPIDCTAVRQKLEEYFEEARISLLFLRNVHIVDFKIYGDKSPRWLVEASRAVQDRTFSEWKTCKLKKFNGSTPTAYTTGKDTWWVAIQDPKDFPEALLQQHSMVRKDVECGIAALVKSTYSNDSANVANKDNTSIEPRFFSHLPLSAEFPTNLPVHIHATFLVSGDRGSIWIEPSARAMGADWNRWLLTVAVPSLYWEFVEDLARKIGQNAYNFWPCNQNLNDSLTGLIVSSFWNLLQKTPDRNVCPFPVARLSTAKNRTSATMVNVKSAIFNFLPVAYSPLSDLLVELFPKVLVTPGPHVTQALQSAISRASTLKVVSVTPSLLRRQFQSLDACKNLNKPEFSSPKVLQSLLEFVTPSTTDNLEQELCELNGCLILPLADSSFGLLLKVDRPRLQAPVNYYVASRAEIGLFDFAKSLLTEDNSARLFKATLLNSHKFNVHKLSLSHMGIILGRKDFSTGTGLEAIEFWLRKFWEYWHKTEKSLGPNALEANFLYKHGIDRYTIFCATCNGVTKYLQPRQLDDLPSVIDPDNKHHQELCEKLHGLYILKKSYIPKYLEEAEKCFNNRVSFERLLKALLKLAARDGQDLEDYVRKVLNASDLKVRIPRWYEIHGI